MHRAIRFTSAALVAIVVASPAQGQQWFRGNNPALSQHTIDPAALGEAPTAFVQYGLPENLGWTAMTGVRFGGGVLRASFTNSYELRGLGFGYARTLLTKQLGPFGTFASGVDLGAGYNAAFGTATADRGARLSLPLSMRWGSPSRLSIAPFVAPFAEVGSRGVITADCPTSCFSGSRTGLMATRSTGLGAGVELTAWRLSFELAQRDVWTHRSNYDARLSAGIRWRF